MSYMSLYNYIRFNLYRFGGIMMVQKCANIIVNEVPAVINLVSVTAPAACYVGDTVTVSVVCDNTGGMDGVANLTFTVSGTGTPIPASKSIVVPKMGSVTTTFTFIPTAASTTQTACAILL
jgi:hypothetical protein